jgi:hypothetical protein
MRGPILRQARVALKRHGPTAPIWRRRTAILGGAVLIGLVALAFAAAADRAGEAFATLAARWWWAPPGEVGDDSRRDGH